MTGLLARIAPKGAVAAELVDAGQPLACHPQEEACVATAGGKRRRDFMLGRSCACMALVCLGRPGVPVLQGARGAPVWPKGLVGSITHTRGYAAALVASAESFLAVGLDAERIGGVTEKLFPRLFNVAERDWLQSQGQRDRDAAATVLFAAKEACYKVLDPLTGTAPSFRDIAISLDGGGFTALSTGWKDALMGRHGVDGDLAVTCAWIGRPGP